jgi:hypothetical protein
MMIIIPSIIQLGVMSPRTIAKENLLAGGDNLMWYYA